jgi:hypothetical protein
MPHFLGTHPDRWVNRTPDTPGARAIERLIDSEFEGAVEKAEDAIPYIARRWRWFENTLPEFAGSETCPTLATLRFSRERIPMSSISGPEHLSGHHRDTLVQIFQDKTNHNVEWHDVVSLLGAIGSIEQQHDDMFLFRIGEETEVLRRPSDKDIDGQQLVDLRRILTSAGYDTVAADLEDKGNEV